MQTVWRRKFKRIFEESLSSGNDVCGEDMGSDRAEAAAGVGQFKYPRLGYLEGSDVK